MGFGTDLFWPAYAAAVLAAAALGAQVLAYSRTSRPVRPLVRRSFLVIRLAAVSLLLLALWRPAAESERTLERKGRLALLVDASKSMSIGDETSGPDGAPCSRLARAAGVFAENAAAWRQVTRGCEVLAYRFADRLTPLSLPPDQLDSRTTFGVEPDGPVTALGDALRKAAGGTPPPQAVLVLSDGLSNSGVEPLDAAIAGGRPVYAISLGREKPTGSTRDISSAGIFAPAQTFEGGEVSVLGAFALTGLEGRNVRVSLFADGREVAVRDIAARSDQEIAEARFEFTADTEGPVRLEVRAQPLSDEIVAVNNSAATFMDVKRGRTKVIYLEGNFRWEAKFIRLAIEAAKDVDLRLVVPRAGGGGEVLETLGENWDVLILGSIPAAEVPAASAEAVEEAVSQKGRGLLFLGGPQGLGRGGYGAGRLAALSPFELAGDEKYDECLWAIEPKGEGPHADVIAFGAERETGVWRELPPLLALNRVGPARPGASVLLIGKPKQLDERTGELSPDPLRSDAPLLALQEYGRGRTAAFAGEGAWQWFMGAGLADRRARDRAAEIHRKFWRQVIFWLARREQKGDVTVNLELPHHRAALGDKVEMLAQVLDEKFEPVTDVELTARIAFDGGEETRTFWVEGTGFRLDFEPDLPGDYGVRVTAKRGGERIADARSAFVVTAADAEFTTLVSRPSLLAAMALATGGEYAPAEQADRVFSQLAGAAKSSRYTRLDRRELWSSYPYLALVLALLTLEWVLRKFAGLV